MVAQQRVKIALSAIHSLRNMWVSGAQPLENQWNCWLAKGGPGWGLATQLAHVWNLGFNLTLADIAS